MGTFSIWHWLVVLAVVLVLFGGGGKISRLMGDFGKGLKSFKKSIREEEKVEEDEAEEKPQIVKSEAAAEPAAEPATEPVAEKDQAAKG